MKKLMMAVAIVCAAVGTQAASVSWSAGKIFDGTDSATGVGTGTAYLFLASTLGQADAVTSFASGDTATITGAAIGSYAIADSKVAYNTISGVTAPTSASSFYYIVFNGDNMLVSEAVNSTYDNVTSIHAVEFASSKNYAKALPSDGAYSGPGWYTASVPEPTSGLLMLLGMAGLALRRRRA